MRTFLAALLLLTGCANTDWDRLGHAVTAGANGYSQGMANAQHQMRVPQSQDHEWAWDQFYAQNYQLVWACRGIQTGQFAEESRCAYKTKFDSRWPGWSLTR